MSKQFKKHNEHNQHKPHFAPAVILTTPNHNEQTHTIVPKKDQKWHLITLLILIVILGSGIFFESTYSDKFYPGESIAGVSVGGKTVASVISYFDARAQVLSGTGITLTLSNNGTSTNVTLPMFAQGLSSDNSFEYFSLGNWKKTIQQSYGAGRTGSLWQRLSEQVALLSIGKNIKLPYFLYEGAVNSFLSYEMANFLDKSKPAQFALNKKGKIYIVPEKIGNDIYIEEVISLLKKKLASYDVSPLVLETKKDIPLATEEKLNEYLPLAQELSQKTNVVFHYKDYSWKVSGAKFVTWLTIKKDNNLGLDSDKLTTFLSKTVALVINDPPENSRFEMRDGKLAEIFIGHSGSVVDIMKTAQRAEEIIPRVQALFKADNNFATVLDTVSNQAYPDIKAGNIDIPIDVNQEQPAVTADTITKYHITDLVGSSTTSFLGSSKDRAHNIALGTSQFNGTLIAPGQEFSALNAIGLVTEDRGYVKEYVIKDNKSIKELGGGLCQVGTTLFRLGLDAGLPITERVPHRYVVKYYGPGLDATIYAPHPDVRWINDTGNYLLLQGRTEGTNLILELYGTKDGRQVSISDPVITDKIPPPPIRYVYTPDLAAGVQQCSETPHTGMTADVTYRVQYPSGKVNEQDFMSIYSPWGTVCLVGTAK